LAVLLPIEVVYLVATELWSRSQPSPPDDVLRQVTLGVGSLAVAVAAFLPWLAYALPSQVAAGSPGLPAFTPGRDFNTFAVLVELSRVRSFREFTQAPLTDLALALAALGLARALWARNARVLLLAALLVLAIPIAWTSDRIAAYFWSERQVIVLLV